MQFGFNVWFKTDVINKNMWKLAVEKGFTHVEFSLDYPWPWEDVFSKAVKSAMDTGLAVGVHLPWRDLFLASPYPELRRASVETLSKIIEYVSNLDVKYAVAHVSTNEWLPEHRMDRHLENISRDLESLAKKSLDSGIKLLIENAQKPLSSRPSYLRKIVEEIGAEACLDLGHIIVMEARRSASSKRVQKTLFRWSSELKRHIGLIHVHGYDDEKKPHKSLSFLPANILSGLQKVVMDIYSRNNNIPIIVEVFYDDEEPHEMFKRLSQELALLREG